MNMRAAPEWVKASAVVVSILGIIAMICMGLWQRSDTRRESASGAYAAVVERVGKLEEWKAFQSEWTQRQDAELRERIDKMVSDFVVNRTLAYDASVDARAAREAAERAEKAANDSRALLVDVLRVFGVAPSQPPPRLVDPNER